MKILSVMLHSMYLKRRIRKQADVVMRSAPAERESMLSFAVYWRLLWLSLYRLWYLFFINHPPNIRQYRQKTKLIVRLQYQANLIMRLQYKTKLPMRLKTKVQSKKI